MGAAFEEPSAVSATVKDVREALGRARSGSAARASGRFCSSTRSTASTRRSRTRCFPRSRGPRYADRRHHREPVLQVARRSSRAARSRAAAARGRARGRRAGAPRRRGRVGDELVALVARGPAVTRNAQHPRARWADRACRGGTSADHAEDAARKRPLVYDKGGDAHYDFVSAFIKSMRGQTPCLRVFYLAAMLEGGEDPRFIARRMIVLASEDVGNADPRALLVAVPRLAVEHVGPPEARLNLAQGDHLRAEVERRNQSARRSGGRRARARAGTTAGRAARRPLPRRRSWGAARATSTRTRTLAGSRWTTCPSP